MPTLVLNDVSVEVYAKLAKSASWRNLTPEEEAKRVLGEAFGPNGQERNGSGRTEPAGSENQAPMPDEPFLSEEMCVPFDLPWPGEGVKVKAVWGAPRLPDPIDVPEDA